MRIYRAAISPKRGLKGLESAGYESFHVHKSRLLFQKRPLLKPLAHILEGHLGGVLSSSPPCDVQVCFTVVKLSLLSTLPAKQSIVKPMAGDIGMRSYSHSIDTAVCLFSSCIRASLVQL